MKSVVKEIHFCDFCNKLYQMKHHCLWHEKHCKKNPNNEHACFKRCENLVKDLVDYDNGYENGYDPDHIEAYGITSFYCKITKQRMYSYIAERRELSCVNDSDYIRMPLSCNDIISDWENCD